MNNLKLSRKVTVTHEVATKVEKRDTVEKVLRSNKNKTVDFFKTNTNNSQRTFHIIHRITHMQRTPCDKR
jgi:hypothetical protein